MYYTNEYSVLKSLDGGKDITLKPGIDNAFPAFKGRYLPTSSARIIELDTKKVVAIIDVKTEIGGIGEVIEAPKPKKKQPTDLLETSND